MEARPFAPDPPARIALVQLEALWLQVTGFLCNLECTHCLVDASPRNHRLGFLGRDAVRGALEEAQTLGVKEVYFTGGEPFLHPEILELLETALAVAPTTVLTNGTRIGRDTAERLAGIAAGSRYSLEVRVSLDHPDPVLNDRIRGRGAHAKALQAVLRLEAAGLLPIVTATEIFGLQGAGDSDKATYDSLLHMLLEAGVARPRLKILPVFHLGKIEDPATGGPVTRGMLEGLDPLHLQCARTRVVASAGIYACPILVGKDDAFLGRGPLTESLRPVELCHHACRTCWETGMTCGNG
jgi:hypothetical protein